MEKIIGTILVVAIAFVIGANRGCSSGKEAAASEIKELRENLEANLQSRKAKIEYRYANSLTEKRKDAERIRRDIAKKASQDEKKEQTDFKSMKLALESEVSSLEADRNRRNTLELERKESLRSLRGRIGSEAVTEYLAVGVDMDNIQGAATEMSALYDAFGRTRQFYSDWRDLSSLLKDVRQAWEKTERDFREAAASIQTEATLFGPAP